MAKEYTVVSGFTIGLLIEKVNKLIKEGWQPIGGISSGGAGYGAIVTAQQAIEYRSENGFYL